MNSKVSEKRVSGCGNRDIFRPGQQYLEAPGFSFPPGGFFHALLTLAGRDLAPDEGLTSRRQTRRVGVDTKPFQIGFEIGRVRSLTS